MSNKEKGIFRQMFMAEDFYYNYPRLRKSFKCQHRNGVYKKDFRSLLKTQLVSRQYPIPVI